MLKCAQIYVFNCGPIGLEALKNLVFGGIGSFTIVYAFDLGNNYSGMLLFLLYVFSLA
jgi:amyloid beta precursor protein binding protein 1